MKTARHPSYRHNLTARARGFTLVELLVVISIISLLLSLLVPALHGARETARTTTCLANLKAIGNAEYFYAEDNGGCITPCDYRSTAFNAPNITWAGMLVGTDMLKMPVIPTSYATHSAATPVTLRTVLQCPSGFTDDFTTASVATARANADNYRPYISAVFETQSSANNRRASNKLLDVWYGANASTGGYNYPMWRMPPDNNTTNYDRHPKLSIIQNPAHMVAFFDGCTAANWSGAARISARHNDGTVTNILLWDGHAEATPSGTLYYAGAGTFSDTLLRKLNPSLIWTFTQVAN